MRTNHVKEKLKRGEPAPSVSKTLHTPKGRFTREADGFWTSCGQKRLKYSANEGGVRCAGDFGANSSLHRQSYEDTTTDCQSVSGAFRLFLPHGFQRRAERASVSKGLVPTREVSPVKWAAEVARSCPAVAVRKETSPTICSNLSS